ncbi:MAG TPA: hypothetical protein VFH73_07950 [Polyangia bacterium]|jgi:hypothetical protein|nr:hypothetical protein [Polyangia bacterium]
MQSLSTGARLFSVATIALTMLAAAAAAQGAETEPETQPTLGGSHGSVASGAFLPWTMGARSDAQRALVYGQGGYDGAAKGAVFQSVIEAQILDRLSLRAGGTFAAGDATFRPEVGLRVDALRQERHGVDLAVLGVYEAKGFNTVRAVTARVALSRAFGDTRVVGNVGYGFGLDDVERYGDFRVAGLHRLTSNLHVGLDSRLRVDLERDNNEPAGEPEWELLAGPVATYSFGRYLISASVGMSALKLRLAGGARAGAGSALGFGAVF